MITGTNQLTFIVVNNPKKISRTFLQGQYCTFLLVVRGFVFCLHFFSRVWHILALKWWENFFNPLEQIPCNVHQKEGERVYLL